MFIVEYPPSPLWIHEFIRLSALHIYRVKSVNKRNIERRKKQQATCKVRKIYLAIIVPYYIPFSYVSRLEKLARKKERKKENGYITFVLDTVKYKLFARKRKGRKFRLSPSIILRQNFVSESLKYNWLGALIRAVRKEETRVEGKRKETQRDRCHAILGPRGDD